MQRRLKDNIHWILLAGIAILSFGLNFYAISQNGTGNEYYAACVKSMTQSLSNFFFVSFDPSGLVSVDKPPLGLWVQAISVLIFGYHGWALMLPQALAGTASCLILYALTAKYFGRPAGLISALVLALTPAAAVVSRNNTMDMQLVFVLLAATWFLFKAIDSGKWRFLILTALFVGLGFNIKMLQAYLILPAIVVTYLIFAKEKFAKRLLTGLISTVVLFAVSFAWVAAVELTPAANRPYVDSTSGNSMLELILGHNGTERLFGSGMGGGGSGGNFRAMDDGRSDGIRREDGTVSRDSSGTDSTGNTPVSQQGNNRQSGATPLTGNNGTPSQMLDHTDGDGRWNGSSVQGGMGGSEIGSASITRLWSSNLYGQSSWLLLFALLSIFGCWNKAAFKKKEGSQRAVVYWALWLAVMVGFFSFAGFYHRYYLCMMAPAIAALSGVGTVTMYRGFRHWRERKKGLARPLFLLLALLVNLALEIRCILNYDALKAWLLPATAAAGGVGLLLLIAYLIRPKRAALILSTAGLTLSLLAAPFYWALTPVLYVPNATIPYAGPELAGNTGAGGRGFGGGGTPGEQGGTGGLEQYLVKNYEEGSFLLVSQRSSDVAQLIIDTGLPCYAYGGFLGSDNSLTLEKLKQYVSEGKIRYFLVSGQGGGQDSELISYVKKNATLVNTSEYGVGASSGGSFGRNAGTLYRFS